MGRICVVGSINMDMVTRTPRVPAMGETITGSGFSMHHGGKGANQAVAAARLGGQVSMIGCVGDDLFGSAMRDAFVSDGMDVSGIRAVSGIPTGTAAITVCDGDNFIILDAGANACVTQDYLMQTADIWQSADSIILQNEIPHTANAYLLSHKPSGATVLYNPAPSMPQSAELLPYVDILVVNEHECADLAGCAKIKTIAQATEGANLLRQQGAAAVIVTLGAQGALCCDQTGAVHVPAFSVAAVDTTAAGDCFCAAVAVQLSNGAALSDAVQFASAASAVTVTRAGAQPSLPTRAEVETFLKAH